MMRDTMLATSAQAIRLSTIAWPSTISMTMMKAVSGACVAAVVAFGIVVVVAAVRASNGERYRYPLTIRFLR